MLVNCRKHWGVQGVSCYLKPETCPMKTSAKPLFTFTFNACGNAPVAWCKTNCQLDGCARPIKKRKRIHDDLDIPEVGEEWFKKAKLRLPEDEVAVAIYNTHWKETCPHWDVA